MFASLPRKRFARDIAARVRSAVVLIPQFLLLGLLSTAAPAFALSPDLAISQFTHDVWQRRDGLPSGVVACIVQSPDGFVWVGTPAGLARFDGVSFTLQPTNPTDLLKREAVSSIAAGPDNVLWVGIRNGGVRGLANGQLTVPDMGGLDPGIRAMRLSPHGVLRIGTATSLMELHGDKIVAVPSPQPYVAHIAYTHSGDTMLGTQNGVYILRSGRTEHIELPTGFTVVERVLEDRSGAIWIGTYHALFHWRDGVITHFGKDHGLAGEHVTALYEDRAGNVWIGTTEGLNRIRPGTTPPIQNSDRLPLKSVLALHEDREGSLWVGTRDGLHRFKDVSVVPWTATEGLLGNFTPSLRVLDDGTIVAFSSGDPTGITRLKDGKSTHQTDLLDGPSFVDRDGVLWVSNSGVLFSVRDQKVERFGQESGIPGKWISAISADDESLLLCISSGVGLRRWRNNRVEPYLLKDGTPFLVSNHVNFAHRARDGSIWMATYDGIWQLRDGGITRYTTAEGEASLKNEYDKAPPGKHHRTITNAGLRETWHTTIAEEADGTLWFGSHRGGLARFKDGSFMSVTAREGLHSDEVYCVLLDDHGRVWMSSPRGIFSVPKAELEELWAGKRARVSCRVFSTEDGMKTEESMHEYQPAGAKAPNGVLWFATKHGIVSIDPNSLRTNGVPPPVAITQLSVDRRSYTRSGTLVPPGGDRFEIHYTALSLLVPERVKFKYQLEGYDSTWVDAGRQRVAYYTKLPPGQYRFRVIAANNDGVWNEQGAVFAFEVKPRFTQTGWFVGLCLLGAAGLVAGVHFWRVRQLRVRETILQERVSQRTMELSQANAELKHEITERQRAERDLERIHQQLLTASHQAGMAEVATGVLHNVGNVLNSVNVSTTVLVDAVKNSRVVGLGRVSALLKEHATDLAAYLSQDPKGRRIPAYLDELATQASTEHATLLRELEGLKHNVDHIRDIVAMQQNYATVAGVVETVSLADLIEDAVRMNMGALSRHQVQLIREFDPAAPTINVEKHKVLQILVNLIQNAKYACDEGPKNVKQIRLGIQRSAVGVQITVEDNGVGIARENLVKIFNHGFTTRKNGHGFGLHSGALAAREMGGSLIVHSAGPGEGARFTLELPLNPPKKPAA